MKRKIKAAASACLSIAVLTQVGATPAHAGTYTVASCRGTLSGVSPVSDAFGGWRHESSPSGRSGLSFIDQCEAGDHLRIEVGGPATFPSGYVYSQAAFRPPVDTLIKDFKVLWEGYAIPSAASKAGFVTVDTEEGRHDEFVGSGRVTDRWTSAQDVDSSYLTLHVGCMSGAALCGGGEPGVDAWARMLRAEVTLSDQSGPTGTVYGSALSDDVWTAARTLSVDSEDRGGGVFAMSLEVDGQRRPAVPVDANDGRCVPHASPRIFLHPRPCLTDPAAKDLAVDVPAFADGAHDLAVVVEDAAGNVRSLPVGRKVFDSHPPVLDGQAAIVGTGRQGDSLTCTSPIIDGQDPEIRFAWVRALADGSGRTTIAGATSQTYVPSAGDVGRKLLCSVMATDRGGTSVSESSLTSGPFADGGTVREICDGMPAGPRDPCGDFDRDGTRNRDDADADGDGVDRSDDPDDLDAAATGRDVTTPSSVHTHTATTTHTTNETVREAPPGGPIGAINGTLGGPGASLTVHHEGSSSRTIRVSHGRRVIVEGRLRAPDGRGIGGAHLEISTQDRASGSPSVTFGAVTTEGDGSYRLILPAGPSRTVRVGYRARFGDATFSQTSEVVVLVRAGLRFRLSRRTLRNRRSVRYSGRLLGPRSGHRFVEVQVRSGRRWIVVCSVRTDAKGGFGCAHRFTRTFRRTRYVFRARVRRQATLPYEPAVSSLRALVVRP